jgi:hypothetical protein
VYIFLEHCSQKRHRDTNTTSFLEHCSQKISQSSIPFSGQSSRRRHSNVTFFFRAKLSKKFTAS